MRTELRLPIREGCMRLREHGFVESHQNECDFARQLPWKCAVLRSVV